MIWQSLNGFLYDFSIGFIFYSTHGTSGGHKMFSQILYLILFTCSHGVILLHKIFNCISILLPALCMFYHNLPVYFSSFSH
jgi:hypothetical protein